MVIPLKLIDQAAGPDRSLSFMSWCVGVIVFPMMLIYFQIKRLSKCALKRLACPTLVLCGRQDALTPVALHE
jgi:pimeloyl-ACP methyl ester carboxylesterase